MHKQNTIADLERGIEQERAEQQGLSSAQLYRLIIEHRGARARSYFLYYAEAKDWRDSIDGLCRQIREGFPQCDRLGKTSLLSFLVELVLDLSSFLPELRLAKIKNNRELRDDRNKIIDLISELSDTAPSLARELHGQISAETSSRLRAEGVTGEAEKSSLTGTAVRASLVEYLRAFQRECENSNLIRASRSRMAGEVATELGNDYSSFLQYFIRQGGTFVTTNPVLIKLARDNDPERWTGRIDTLIGSRYTAGELKKLLDSGQEQQRQSIHELNSLITMMVVEENCRLLRDIFLLTKGKQGYVSLQVNPQNHDDEQKMTGEAENLYEQLCSTLGGVANVVFKLPATHAGLRAAAKLTGRGIGVTITVNFSVLQSIEFAKVLDRGRAPVSYIALMNGRLAFPVRDELEQRGIREGENASRWAGVEVARKTYRNLYGSRPEGGLEIDPTRVKMVIASLRIYEDWIPDISELWGCPVITIFPNVRRAFEKKQRQADYRSITGQTPPEALDTLFLSEIFRQAWWIPGDQDIHKPRTPLSLDPQFSAHLVDWTPIRETLGQFNTAYVDMSDMVRQRMQILAGR